MTIEQYPAGEARNAVYGYETQSWDTGNIGNEGYGLAKRYGLRAGIEGTNSELKTAPWS